MRRSFGIALCGLLALGVVAGPQVAAAQDCPDARQGRTGFVPERNDNSSQIEVFHDGSMVRSIYRYRGRVLLETTQFEGLFELDRIDRGRRSTFKPDADLAKLFPLKMGQGIVVAFEMNGAAVSAQKRVISLRMIGEDELYIGRCKYKVLKIERKQSTGNAPPVFIDFDYYAPELKLIVAKEYKDTTLIKYDRIYPSHR